MAGAIKMKFRYSLLIDQNNQTATSQNNHNGCCGQACANSPSRALCFLQDFGKSTK
jgi:hypothetical protein